MTDLEALTAAHNSRIAIIDPLLPVAPVPAVIEAAVSEGAVIEAAVIEAAVIQGVMPTAAGGTFGGATFGGGTFGGATSSGAMGEGPRYGIVADELIAVPGAVAIARTEVLDPAALEATWGTLTQHRLVSGRIAGADPIGAMDALLGAWRERVAAQPADERGESSAVVVWPSRDTAMTNLFLDRGLSARSALAARSAGRSLAADLPAGLTIRPLAGHDVEAAAALQVEEIAWDAQFGAAVVRAATPDRVREEVATALATGLTAGPGAERASAWVGVRGDEVVAYLSVEWPSAAAWVSGQVGGDKTRVAYIGCLSVAPGGRGGGIGAALVGHVHRELDAAGIQTTVLHYAALNPLSVPFWSRCGYRPLWTGWEVRPHTELR